MGTNELPVRNSQLFGWAPWHPLYVKRYGLEAIFQNKDPDEKTRKIPLRIMNREKVFLGPSEGNCDEVVFFLFFIFLFFVSWWCVGTLFFITACWNGTKLCLCLIHVKLLLKQWALDTEEGWSKEPFHPFVQRRSLFCLSLFVCLFVCLVVCFLTSL